jgi:hypothetical protein|mmetsp:Transcript_90156/g.270942  ORF Transcript_90156/g.270942 Transcript_90156/m.270942 type:complete len:86 (-) Transcript_90156:76-333(-)
MINPFLRKESASKKFYLLRTPAELHAHLPAEGLPLQLGGAVEFDWDTQIRAWQQAEIARADGFDVSRILGEVDLPAAGLASTPLM